MLKFNKLINAKRIYATKPIQIVIVSLIFLIISPYLSLEQYNLFYSLSILVKDIMMFILPFSVFAYIASSLIKFENKAWLFILLLLVFEAISNASSVLYSYFIYKVFSVKAVSFAAIENKQFLTSYFRLDHYKPKIWSPDKGALAGIFLGLYLIYNKNAKNVNFVYKCRDIANFIFSKIFSPLIPLLIPGFIANFIYNKSLNGLVIDSGINIVTMIITLIIYVLFLFFLGADFNKQIFFRRSVNALPSMVTAFSTMCSIMTMPITIDNAEKNLDNPKYGSIIIPMTSNVQMVGDCFINGFLCLVVMNKFGHKVPDFLEWCKFTSIFVFVRYLSAGVSGGTTFLILPLYEKYLGFSQEMQAIMLGLNVILDPIATAFNVYANGALVIILEKILQYLPKFSKKEVKLHE